MCPAQSSHALRERALELLPPELLNAHERVVLALKPSAWLIGFLCIRLAVVVGVVTVGIVFWGPTGGGVWSVGWLVWPESRSFHWRQRRIKLCLVLHVGWPQ